MERGLPRGGCTLPALAGAQWRQLRDQPLLLSSQLRCHQGQLSQAGPRVPPLMASPLHVRGPRCGCQTLVSPGEGGWRPAWQP